MSINLSEEEYVISKGITQSLLAKWLRCRQYAEYYLQGWRTPPKTETTQFGILLHEFLQGWYSKQNGVDWSGGLNTMYEREIENAIDADAAEEVELNFAKLEAIIPTYLAYWMKEDEELEWQGLEYEFDVIWSGYRLRGKIDGIHAIKNTLRLFETKTKSRIDENIINDTLEFDFQNLYYLLSYQVESRIQINSVLYNIIRNPSLKKKAKETYKTYSQRILSHIAEKGYEYYFKRFEVTYDSDRQQKFRVELQAKLSEFSQWLANTLPTYKNENACMNWGACTYLKACASCSMDGYLQNGLLFEELSDANQENIKE